jgi:hypothetical protein
VEARWSEPGQLNGVLQRYLLYVSTDNSSVGEVVYNNSDFFTDYIIPDLEAGTQYFIRAGVSKVWLFPCAFKKFVKLPA